MKKIAVNFEYDAERQKLILELIDGTYQEIDMSALITEYEFEDSAYISWTVADGKVKAEIIGGSITEDMLQPNFLADCRLYAGNAENSATLAEEYAKQAKESAESISNKAGDISFDDTVAQLGANNVQGAIENVKSGVDAVSNKVSSIGTVINSNNISTSGTVFASKQNVIGTINLEAGTWLIEGQIRWGGPTFTGKRGLLIYNSSYTLQYPLWAYTDSVCQNAINTNFNQKCIRILTISTPYSYTLYAQHDVSGDLDYAVAALKAVKLG